MIITPAGKIISVESGNILCPSIDVVLVKNDGTKEMIASIEYNREDEHITTHTYKDGKEKFDKKTVYNTKRI